MKKFMTSALLAALLSLPALANDQAAKETLHRQLAVNADSVTLKAAENRGQGTYLLTLSFQILPMSSCQENFVGLLEQDVNQYTALYATSVDERCKAFGLPRTVEQTILVQVRPNSLPPSAKIELNGNSYLLTDTRAGLNLRRVVLRD